MRCVTLIVRRRRSAPEVKQGTDALKPSESALCPYYVCVLPFVYHNSTLVE